MSLSSAEAKAMRAIGRRAAEQVGSASVQGGLSREFARVTKVYDDGRLDLDKGTDDHPMPILSVRMITGCQEPSVGDVAVVDTYAYVPLVTGILATSPMSPAAELYADPGAVTSSNVRSGFYMSFHATVVGIAVGYNISPSASAATRDVIFTLTTARAFADSGERLIRGTHANHQSGMFVSYGSDGHTITVTSEQADSWGVSETGNFLIPVRWKL